MSSQNKIILIGNPLKEPDVKMSTSGQPVANFLLSVERPRSGDSPAYKDNIPVVAWQENAELLENCSTDTTLLIEGRIQTRTYDTNEGVRKYVTEVDARVVQKLGQQQSNINEESSGPQYNFGSSSPTEAVAEPTETLPDSLEEKAVETPTMDNFDFEDPFSDNDSNEENVPF